MKFVFIVSLIFVKTILPQEVPLDTQYILLLKIITFDKEFQNKFNEKVVIGIIYQNNFKTSANQKNELVEIIKEKNFFVKGKKVEYQLMNIFSGNIYESIVGSEAKIIFILPLKGIDIKDITDITQKEKILSFTGVSEYIKNGIAVCINIKDGKPSIVINLGTSKQEGAEFNSQLLSISEVINN